MLKMPWGRTWGGSRTPSSLFLGDCSQAHLPRWCRTTRFPAALTGAFSPFFPVSPSPPPAAHPALLCLMLALLTSSQPPPCRSLLSPPLGQVPKSPNPQIPKFPNPTRIVPLGCKQHKATLVPPRVGIGRWGSSLQPSPSCCRMGRAGGEGGKGESRGLGWGFSPPHCAPRATPGCSRMSGDGAGGTEPVPRFFGEKRHKKELQK